MKFKLKTKKELQTRVWLLPSSQTVQRFSFVLVITLKIKIERLKIKKKTDNYIYIYFHLKSIVFEVPFRRLAPLLWWYHNHINSILEENKTSENGIDWYIIEHPY